MNREKTWVIIALAILLGVGGAIYMLRPDYQMDPNMLDSVLPRNDTTTTVSDGKTSATVTTTTKKDSNMYLGRDGVYVVQYTKTGFVPSMLQIPQGKSVRFINMTDGGMRIYSDNNSDPKFVELNQSKTVGKGATYTFSFVNTGIWQYHNEVKVGDHANIVVY